MQWEKKPQKYALVIYFLIQTSEDPISSTKMYSKCNLQLRMILIIYGLSCIEMSDGYISNANPDIV